MSNEWNTDPDPLAGGDKAPAVSFKNAPVGTVVVLNVTSTAKLVQQRDFESGELATWKDGNPRMAVVINGTVDGEEHSLWAPKPSAMFAALVEAQKAAGQRIGPGGKLSVKYTGDKPNDNPRLKAQRLYAAKYEAPDPFADATPATPAQRQPVAAAAQSAEPPF